MVDTRENVAVLVGNGLSIAFNPELSLQRITEEVLSRIQAAEGDDVVSAMQAIAEQALPCGVTSANDFELLVGAFGAEARTLGILSTLAELTRATDQDLLQSIKSVVSFAEQVRDNGVSYVLEVIAERSHCYLDQAEDLHRLIGAITGSFAGQVTFGNLNYDTLLLAALLTVCKADIADLGHGYQRVAVQVDGKCLKVPALRTKMSDFPQGKRVQLLHLHGSLTYWASRDTKVHAKLPKELVEKSGQWKAVRERTTDVRPVVVLASQRDKAEHVGRFPFTLAYEMFSHGLARSNHWIVIGYSFRDDPVNARLREEFIGRAVKPKVLVVTYGEDPSRQTVERAFGWGAEDGSSNDWLTINRGGANGFDRSSDWKTFVAAGRP